MKYFLRLLFVLALHSSAYSQNLSSTGTEFWIGFMPNYIVPATTISLLIGAETDSRVNVDFFGPGGMVSSSKVINVKAKQQVTVSLSVGLAETRERETAQYKAMRVRSTAPISLHGMTNGSATTDGYLALPLAAFGKKYYVMSYFDDAYQPGIDHLGGEFMVIAPYDSTIVTITTKATTTLTDNGTSSGHTPGETWSVLLQRGQTYLVQTTGWKYGVEDITGSLIESTKPVAVLSGHQRAGIEIGEANNSKDHLIEMLPPVEAWGTEYHHLSMIGRTKAGDFLRIISAEDDNQIKRNDATHVLDQGEYASISQSLGPSTIRSLNSKKFLTMAYLYTQGAFADPGVGDPDMITMIPLQGFQNKALITIPENTGGTPYSNYLTFIGTEAGLESIRIERDTQVARSLVSMGASGIFSFPGTDLLATRLRVSERALHIAKGNEPFAVYQYGYTGVESYGWPSSMGLDLAITDTTLPATSTSAGNCGEYTLTARDPSGIASIRLGLSDLGQDSSFNYQLTVPSTFIVGDTSVTVTIKPLDNSKHGRASLEVIDRGGNRRIEHLISPAEFAIAAPANDLNFEAASGDTVCRSFYISNTGPHDWDDVRASFKNVRYFVVTENKTFDIAAGDSIRLTVCYTPSLQPVTHDTLRLAYACGLLNFGFNGRNLTRRLLPDSLDLGTTLPSSMACTEIQVKNFSDSEMVLVDIRFVEPGFSANYTPGDIYPPGMKRTIKVCYTGTTPGTYITDLLWTFDSGHQDTTHVTVMVEGPSSVAEIPSSDIRIWPNPVSDLLRVEFDASRVMNSYQIADTKGMIVARTKVAAEAKDSVSVSVADLPNGAYQLILDFGNLKHSIPFVIQR